ncbi:unnamed protein product [Ectocarpus sp. CCAP 1310/34]|nr:unnamed protein product [Ectocarpus sp. CCAP 1310/34]
MVVTTVVFSRELDRIDSTTFCPASAKAFIVFVPCGVSPVSSVLCTWSASGLCSSRRAAHFL